MVQAEQIEPPRAYEAAPSGPRSSGGISGADGLTVYGPLGIGWAITLAILAVVWRELRSQRVENRTQVKEFLLATEARERQHALELERRDAQCRAERDEFRATLTGIAKEFAEASKKGGELWREHARELRVTLESASRKIGSRE